MLNVFFLVSQNKFLRAFFGGSLVKNLPANAADTGLISDWEDPTYLRSAKSVYHNYWACALEPGSRDYYGAHVPELLKLEPPREKSHQNEKPTHCS